MESIAKAKTGDYGLLANRGIVDDIHHTWKDFDQYNQGRSQDSKTCGAKR